MSLLSEITALKAKIAVLEAELGAKEEKLKNECLHPKHAVDSEYSTPDCDWDKFKHYYWYHKCSICGHSWQEEAGVHDY
jgi:hypothetical protein